MSDEFVVHDKRLFTKDGEINPEAAETAEKAGPEPRAAEAEKIGPAGGSPSAPLPPANFAGLLIGLATSALLHLGESPEPEMEAAEADLPAAKHAIDLLAVLQTKTRGNLEPEEESLLTALLYDLRMKYVQANK